MSSEAQPISIQDIQKGDFVFLVVGVPGAGRTTFISHLTGFNTDTLGKPPARLHDPRTRQNLFIRFKFQDRSVVVVDTLGYENGDIRASTNILSFVTKLEEQIGRGPDGVVYVQKAIHRRLDAQALLTSSLLIPRAKTLHSSSPKNPPFLPPLGRVLLVTTHWHEVNDDQVIACQQALTKESASLMKRGAIMMAFQADEAPPAPAVMPRADAISTSGSLEGGNATSASTLSSRTQLASRVGSEEELSSLAVDWTLRGATDIARVLFDDQCWPQLRAYEEHIRLERETLAQDTGEALKGRTGGCGCWQSFLSLFR